jgi:hypothetical protein
VAHKEPGKLVCVVQLETAVLCFSVHGKREEKNERQRDAYALRNAQRPIADPRFFFCFSTFLSPWLSRVRRRGCNTQPNIISFIAESKRDFVDLTDTTDTQVRNPFVPDRKIHQLLVVEKHCTLYCTWVYPTIIVPLSRNQAGHQVLQNLRGPRILGVFN